jgi:hypothetical protein
VMSGFLWWRWCGYKYCAFGWEQQGIMVEICTWTTSCRLEDLSPQLMIWTDKKVKNLSRKSVIFSERHSRKVKLWFTKCQWDIAGFGYEMCVLGGCHVSLQPKWREQDWKHVSDYLLAMKVRIMIFCTAVRWQ